MSLTAYVRIRGSYIEEEVTYDLGPVWVTKPLTDGFYVKTGFKPQATALAGTPSDVMLGDGVSSTGDAGPFVRFSTPGGAPTLAVPDEMIDAQEPRDRQYNMSYLTFYGAAEAGKVFTTNFSGDANQLTCSVAHGLYNGALVTVESSSALPAGLVADTLYYVVNRAATTLELALTVGGTPITLTGNGTGTHKVVPFTVVGDYARNLNPRFSNGRGALVS